MGAQWVAVLIGLVKSPIELSEYLKRILTLFGQVSMGCQSTIVGLGGSGGATHQK